MQSERHHARSRVRAIDGVRGLGIAAVLGYHGWPSLVPGGLLGVEVFFVLSGYLLTALLLDEHRRRGRVDWLRYLARRARRVAPALGVFLVGVVVLGAVLARADAHRLRADVVWSALGLTNWHLVAEGNSYFGGVGRPPLVRHLWSLAVEIQFYALLPLVVAALVRRPRRIALRWLAGAVAASSLLMAALYQSADPSRAYYGTDTRVGALLSGALLAWALGRAPTPRARPARWGPAAGAVALAALMLLMVLVDERSRFLYPAGFLLCRLATALVIVSASAPGRLARLFESRLPQWLGLRSYSIYLWHWPFLALARPGVDVGGPRWLATGLALTAGIGAGHLSYRFVEARAGRRTPAPVSPERRLLAGARWANAGVALAATAVLLAHLPTVDPIARRLRVGQEALAAQPGPAAAAPTTSTAPPPTTEPAPPPTEAPVTTAAPQTTAPPPAEPAPAPLAPPAGPAPGTVPVTAIGDSVMVSAAPALQERLGATGYIDAKLSRQFSHGVEVARHLREQGALGQVVIVHLGTNGPPRASQVDALMAELAAVPHVRLVTVRTPERWEAQANQVLRDAPGRHPTVQVVDWHAHSEGRREWFESDGTHVKRSGAAAYAELLTASVPAPAPPTTTTAPPSSPPAVELPLPPLPMPVAGPRGAEPVPV